MRALADGERIHGFLRALGRAAVRDGRCYLAGGATAVLVGWRASTVDVDIKLDPDDDALLRALPRLKDELQVNVELASPMDFIPVAAGWEGRSPFAARESRLTFLHFDPHAQALAKLERAHAQDVADVEAMVERGLVDPGEALRQFAEIEPDLYRFPAVDPRAFRRRVDEAFGAPR